MLSGVPDEEMTDVEREVLLKVKPEGIEAMTAVAFSHLENGRFPQARALFEAVATLRPKEDYALSGVAAAALGQKERKTALVWYDRALTHDPKHIPSLVGRGETLVRLGEVGRRWRRSARCSASNRRRRTRS